MTQNPTAQGEGLNYIDQQVAEVEDWMRARIKSGEFEVDGPEDAAAVIAQRGLLRRRELERKQGILLNDYCALTGRPDLIT